MTYRECDFLQISGIQHFAFAADVGLSFTLRDFGQKICAL